MCASVCECVHKCNMGVLNQTSLFGNPCLFTNSASLEAYLRSHIMHALLIIYAVILDQCCMHVNRGVSSCVCAHLGVLASCTVCICLCTRVCIRVCVRACECVCGSVSGIKKPSHRQSPAVNETGPDVGARGGDRTPLGGISRSPSSTHAHTPHTDTVWGPFPTADEYPEHSSRFQDESQVHLERSDMLGYGPLTHQQSTKTLDLTDTRTHTRTCTRAQFVVSDCTHWIQVYFL